MKNIELTLPEWSCCFDSAWLRIVTSAAQNLDPATTYKRSMIERITEEVTGTAGELAVAKYLGEFLVPGVGTFHRVSDCGGFEVRSTRHPGGHLIVRDNDAQDRRFILAIVADQRSVRLAGWLHGWEAARPQWRRASSKSERMAWWVPQDKLHRMETINESHS